LCPGDARTQIPTKFATEPSAQRYLGDFVAVAMVKLDPVPEDPLTVDRNGWDVPLPLAIGLGVRIARGESLSADWLLAWFLCHPEKILRTPARRASTAFEAMFTQLFKDRFPDGLKVTKPRKTLSATYQAASGEFTADLTPEVDGSRVLDVSGLRKPIEIAQEIADEAMNSLDAYSRLLGRDESAADTLRAHLMLPAAIRSQFPCPARDDLMEWAQSIIVNGSLVPVLDAIERVTGARPDKPGKRDLCDTSDMLIRIGIGMAPDPRFALRLPKPEEPVVLFDLGQETDEPEAVSPPYVAAMLRIALGAYVAQADGRIAGSERTALIAQVGSEVLATDNERRHLMANLIWFLSVPLDLAMLRKRLKEASPAEADTLRAALVAAAHSDGEVSPDEVASLEKAYRALGIDAALVYSDLHAGEAADPVAVRAARPGASGEVIPTGPVRVGPAPLNLDLVAAIRTDTARVSAVLGSIFQDDASTLSVVNTEAEDSSPSAVSIIGLDPAHTRIVRLLLRQDHWDAETFDGFCRAEGLMSAGVLETINEWAFDTYDEALIDAYDGYDIDPQIAATLRTQTEESPCLN
jgi:tellurite resistance protein